jgi:hypothetical protein
MPAASAAAAAVLLSASLAAAPGPAVLFRLQDPALLESSGLAVSGRHDGIVWTHPDGGTVARVMAVDRRGDTVATLTLAGIDPYDPEALAPGSDGRSLWLGDIGDNSEQRPDVSVFEVFEPRRLADRTVRATWYRFTYPDGPHDAEALLYDHEHGRLLIATKSFGDAGLYQSGTHLVTEDAGVNRLERVADVPPLVTDGAFLPDGRFVLRTYSDVHVYDRPGHEIATVALPPQPQGESVAADGDDVLLVGSEGRRSAVWQVPLPAEATLEGQQPAGDVAGAPATSGDQAAGDQAASADRWRTAYLVARVMAIVVVLAGIVVALRRRRR